MESSEVGKPKKKVLVIIPDRFEKATGGMGANSAPLFAALADEFEFYVTGFPLDGTNVPSFVTKYHEVASPFTEIKYGPLATLTAQARYFAESITFPKPDLIYAFDWSIYQAAMETANFFKVPLIARMCLSPILLGQQGYTFGLNLQSRAEKAIHNAFCEMEIRGLKRADRIVHVSRGYQAQYEKFVSFKDKTRLVINGIDLAKWQKEIVPYKLPGKVGRKKVIFLGRLAEMKGIVPLCKASVPEGIDLIFIGPKKTADAVCMRVVEEKVSEANRAAEGGAANVHLLDALYDQDKIRALRSADAIIVPSYHEPFGGVGLEGLAAGCTVLTSRAGGLSDYLNDETSIYCGTTPESIERAFSELLTQTDEARNNMREAGFEMCRKLTLESATDQLRAVFTELTN